MKTDHTSAPDTTKAAASSDPGATAGTTANPGDEVLGLLGRQAELYRRLQSLADRQRRAVRTEDAGPLLDLLADRRKLTDELAQVSARLTRHRANWDAVRNGMSEQQRRTAEALLKEADERVIEILAGDETDARMLAARKNRAAAAVSSAHAGSRMLAAYGQQTAPNPAHFDRRDEES